MATFNAVATDLDYTPSDVTGHAIAAGSAQRANLFVPGGSDFTMPATGFPLVCVTDFGGFTNSTLPTSITVADTLEYLLLRSGVAVLRFQMSAAGSDYSTVPPLLGRGLFHLPAAAGGASGKYENVLYPCCYKDVAYLLSYIRKNAADLGGVGVKIDETRIGYWGSSAGLFAGFWCILGPERMAALGSAATDTQYAQSTRVACFAGRLAGVSFPAFVQATTTGVLFPTADSNDTQATNLSDVTEAALKQQASAAWFFDSTLGMPPGFVYYQASNVSTEYVDWQSVSDSETDIHSAWSGFTLKSKFSDKIRLGLYANTTLFNANASRVNEYHLAAAPVVGSGLATGADAAAARYFANQLTKGLYADFQRAVRMRAGASPVTEFAGNAATHASGSLAAAGNTATAFAANPNRRKGVFIQNTSFTNGRRLIVNTSLPASDTDGFVLSDHTAAGTGLRGIFIPGNGAVGVRAHANGAVTWAGYEL